MVPSGELIYHVSNIEPSYPDLVAGAQDHLDSLKFVIADHIVDDIDLQERDQRNNRPAIEDGHQQGEAGAEAEANASDHGSEAEGNNNGGGEPAVVPDVVGRDDNVGSEVAVAMAADVVGGDNNSGGETTVVAGTGVSD